jgi:hypothetical protein
MKKTFPLHVPGKENPRVVQAIKLELTKYVKRERRKTLPPDVDFWHFNCKVGSASETAAFTPLPDVPRSVERVAQSGATEVYVEILATPVVREKRSSSGQYPRQDR